MMTNTMQVNYLYRADYSYSAYPAVAIAEYDSTPRTLLQYYDYHIRQERQLIGIAKSQITVRTYEMRMKKITSYLKLRNETDIKPNGITTKWINEFDRHLRIAGLSDSYIAKNMQLLRMVLAVAREAGDMERNPFELYKFKYNRKYDRTVLTLSELSTLYACKFRSARLTHVRDLFVFQCLTGLAYMDTQTFLASESLQVYPDGRTYISICRGKTKQETLLPYFKEPGEIAERYGGRLPRISNQKFNSYLKEVFEIAGIEKHATSHVARRTFGDIMHNSYGVPIDSVSRMLGHSDIRTTQAYYVRTKLDKVMRDVQGDLFFKQ